MTTQPAPTGISPLAPSRVGWKRRQLLEDPATVAGRLALGNGILTVDTLAQAEERADPKRGDKGGDAARAALALAALKRKLDVS